MAKNAKGGQGPVARGSKSLVSAMLTGGLAEYEDAISRAVQGGGGTINQKLMAAAAGLWSSSREVVEKAVATLRGILGDEIRFGPTWKEPLCPDSHSGMYWIGWLGVIAAGLRPGAPPEVQELGRMAALISGWMLRLGDLVAPPGDGDCKGLPGNRAPGGAELGRRSHTNVYREVRGLPHRGPGGNKMALKWSDSSDPLVDGAAWWARLLFATPAGKDLLRSPWSPDAPLPPRLRLSLTVARWGTGTLAWFDNPGEEMRAGLLTHGSKSARREGRPEPVVDWIQIDWTKPGKHQARAGLNWETPRPEPPAAASRITIPGI